ncbi:MAG: glutathione S-transferase N-terminal domain-containing protein [Pseudomonadota bacterium]|nr:MAG: glutathione S-transferase N-terminal domain-containing protein [Pseudomonadota bacterium]
MVRLVLAEKGISFDVQSLDPGDTPEDLKDLNPYNEVPTLVDRELVLYGAQIIMEYLDERFPHPPLMPVDPVSRAQNRLMLYRIKRDWYDRVDDLEGTTKAAASAREAFRDSLVAVSPIFEQKPYFMSDELSLVDCAFVPLLWRLPGYGITLPPQAKALQRYAKKMFNREAFSASLTDAEREMQSR